MINISTDHNIVDVSKKMVQQNIDEVASGLDEECNKSIVNEEEIVQVVPPQQTDSKESTSIDKNDQNKEGSSNINNSHVGVPQLIRLANSLPLFFYVILCPKSTVKVVPCGTADKAISIFSSPRFNVSKALIINTGVNDLEYSTTEEVTRIQLQMVNLAMDAFPGKKVIVSSITPRDDRLDSEVRAVNKEVQNHISNSQSVICW